MSGWVSNAVERLYGFRLAILLIVHVVLIVISNQAAFWLRFDGEVPPTQQPLDTEFLPLLLVVRLAVFVPMRLHQGVWRYASIWDLRLIIVGVCVSSVIFWGITHGLLGITVYPRSVITIDAILLIMLMGGVRMARRIYDVSGRSGSGKRVLIFGAGDAGESIVRDILLNARFDAQPVGFVDDDPRKTGLRIHGVPVLGTREQLPEILRRSSPQELLIAIPSATPKNLRSIVRVMEPFKIRITTLPRLQDISGDVDVSQIRQLQVEDLLAREPVGLDDRPVRRFLEGRRIVVTGAGGSIGSELCRQIVKARPEMLVLLDQYENGIFQIQNELLASKDPVTLHPVVADITDEIRIEQTFATYRPDVVFHAAAHKHVPLMELNPCEAVKNNVRGTRIVAEAARRHNVGRFVLISSDKAVNPTSVMGGTKRVAELIIDRMNASKSTRYTAVRFGNVLGSSGSVVPTFLSQIAKGGPVTVTHPEMRRFFMLIPEAVQLVLHAGALDDHAPLLVLDMGVPVSVTEMARDLIRLSGYVPDKDIAIEFTGIRPGEKLVEELVAAGEVAETSSVDKVLRVSAREPLEDRGLTEALTQLEHLAVQGRSDEVLRQLQDILKQFCLGPAAAAKMAN